MPEIKCFAIVPSSRDKLKQDADTELVKDQRHGLMEKSVRCGLAKPCDPYRQSEGPKINYEQVYQKIIFDAVKELNKENARRKIKIVCTRGIDLPQAGTIATQLIEEICRADISITDLTSLNPNVLFELGIRLAVKAHLNIIICHEGTTIPFNLTGYRCIPYNTSFGGETAKTEIKRQITSYLNDPSQYLASTSQYYHNVDYFTEREANIAKLKAYGDVPELVAGLASQVLKNDGDNLKVKAQTKTFFDSVAQAFSRYP